MSIRGRGIFDEVLKTTEVYSFRVNSFGIHSDFDSSNLNRVEIIFEDGKFSHCNFPFRGTYTRQQWDILGDIADKIKEIEGSK